MSEAIIIGIKIAATFGVPSRIISRLVKKLISRK